jgi:hypothetical protein
MDDGTAKEGPPMQPSPELEKAHDALARISAALRGLRYGTVTAVVQDGVVVQVERTEKIRIERREPRSAS